MFVSFFASFNPSFFVLSSFLTVSALYRYCRVPCAYLLSPPPHHTAITTAA